MQGVGWVLSLYIKTNWYAGADDEGGTILTGRTIIISPLLSVLSIILPPISQCYVSIIVAHLNLFRMKSPNFDHSL